jgi:hypothetical protein
LAGIGQRWTVEIDPRDIVYCRQSEWPLHVKVFGAADRVDANDYKRIPSGPMPAPNSNCSTRN